MLGLSVSNLSEDFMKSVFALLVAVAALPAVAQAQDPAQTQVLRVFLDCTQCDFNNLRQDITFVNYVSDRSNADVHVLITTQDTATGGREYTFEFIGIGAFADIRQPMIYSSNGTDTEDERRRGVSRTFSLGLTPFLVRTPAADRFSLRYTQPAGRATASQPENDPWNNWIFRVGSSLEINAEERQNSNRVRANINANRTTDRWKFSVSSNGDFNHGKVTLSDGREIDRVTESWSASGSITKSIGPSHWAALVRTEVRSSTQSNEKLDARQAIGVEWDYFPYSESTRRSFVIQYSVGIAKTKYNETTIFGKLEETVSDHRLAAILALRQPWGTMRTSAAYSAFLHDKSLYNIDLFADADIRLFRGFGLNVEGSYARVRNQIYLAAGGATDEEVLLQLRRLGTGYRYRMQVGFTFQFGSIFNNVVNPRWSATTGRGFGGGGPRGGGD